MTNIINIYIAYDNINNKVFMIQNTVTILLLTYLKVPYPLPWK